MGKHRLIEAMRKKGWWLKPPKEDDFYTELDVIAFALTKIIEEVN